MKKQFLICMALMTCIVMVNRVDAQTENSVKVSTKKRSRDNAGKIVYTGWIEMDTRTVAGLPDFIPVTNQNFTRYGSNPDKKFESTGFFRVEKIGDRWWIIDPEGFSGMHIAVNSVNIGKSERNQTAFKARFGNTENWIDSTNLKLHELGFNGTGSWSDHDAIRNRPLQQSQPLAYTINWNFMSSYGKERGGTFQQPGHTGYPKNSIFVFDPEFETFCDKHAQKLVPYKDDPNLFGHFSDNEMPFPENALNNYLSLPPEDPGYKAALKWVKENNVDTANLTPQIKEKFRGFVGETYFSIVSKAIKKYDPNHLFLGSRLYSSEKSSEHFMRAIGKYIDILSINYYNVWTPLEKHMNEWTSWSGRPFIITEWYTKGADSGLANISGAGWIVKTQHDRGLFYQNYTLALLQSKKCVGWHWFKYQDNDPTAKGVDPSNTDGNKGIVDNDFNYYSPLTNLMKQLNINRYQLIDYFDNQK